MGSGNSCNQGLAACLPSPKPVLEYKASSNLAIYVLLNADANLAKSNLFSFNLIFDDEA